MWLGQNGLSLESQEWSQGWKPKKQYNNRVNRIRALYSDVSQVLLTGDIISNEQNALALSAKTNSTDSMVRSTYACAIGFQIREFLP